jgi:hypothetical protein
MKVSADIEIEPPNKDYYYCKLLFLKKRLFDDVCVDDMSNTIETINN